MKEGGGVCGGGLSAETAAPCSIFDYHIIETVFTAVHSAHVAAGVKYSCGWDRGGWGGGGRDVFRF